MTLNLMHGDDNCSDDLQLYIGWHCQEKFRGVRFVWDGCEAYTRSGNRIQLPGGWRESMPKIALDCELYDGVYGERQCASAARFGPKHFTETMRIIAFDCQQHPGEQWLKRIQIASEFIDSCGFDRLTVATSFTVQSACHLAKALADVLGRAGEGLMLRRPGSLYVSGRHRDLVKLKFNPSLALA